MLRGREAVESDEEDFAGQGEVAFGDVVGEGGVEQSGGKEGVAEAAAFAVLVEEVTCIGVVISGKRMEHRRTSLGFV